MNRLFGSAVLLLATTVGQSCSDKTVPIASDRDGAAGDGGTIAPPIPKAVALRIDPPNATVVTDGIVSARQAFTVFASLEGGTEEEATDKVTFAVSDRSAGRMEGASFVSGLAAAETDVTAQAGDLRATAHVIVRLERAVVVPIDPMQNPIPANPGTIIMNAPVDASRAPVIVYPNDGALLPPNLGGVEIHYRRGDGDNRLFRIDVEGDRFALRYFSRCRRLGAGCLLEVGGDDWRLIAAQAGGRGQVRLRITGTDDAGTAAGVSGVVSIQLAARPVAGGIYYWTTSNGAAIMRVDFGAADRTPQRYFPYSDDGHCYGCHALSPNGRRMTLSRSGKNEGQLTLLDVSANAILLGGRDDVREQFQSWNPTSDKFAAIWGDGDPADTNIRIRSGITGEVLETIPVGIEPSHPDWARAGDRIIYTAVTHHRTSQRPGRGGISYVTHDGAAWGSPRELIAPADGKNRYYPTYSPDATFFVYCESTCDRGTYGDECDADADPSAKLWAMGANGGQAVFLGKVNTPGVEDGGEVNLSNTFPKWAPFVDARSADGTGRVMWMTFSSRRQYGLRSPRGSNQLLWMAAVDPDEVAAGRDGSYPAFALPFQDLQTSNHIAQWTTQIVPPDPGSGADGGTPGGGTDGGTPACLTLGDPCDPANDRCCAGTYCSENGPNIFICRPAL